MRIIAKRTCREFAAENPAANDALDDWYRKTKDADWANFAEVKQTFNSADYVGDHRVVFDIKGNHFRLVALIIFPIRTVLIRFIGTHKAYDKIDCSTI